MDRRLPWIILCALGVGCASHTPVDPGADVLADGAVDASLDTAVVVDAGAEIAPVRMPDVYDPPGDPRFNRVFRIATHNSYWIDRDTRLEVEASGVQEHLLDQLLLQHARGVEIDVHPDPAVPHSFQVFHTDDLVNSLCTPLPECVAMLRTFHHLVPNHEGVVVVVELKELHAQNFDDTHTPADLDQVFLDGLGAALYTPQEFLSRCPAGTTMRDCARTAGWPTVNDLRGRFVLSVIGNYRQDFTTDICHLLHPRDPCPPQATDDIEGHGPAGWVTYATWNGGVSARAGFPMRSNWVHFNGTPDEEQVDPTLVGAADAASVIWQVEDLTDPTVPDFLEANGLVRGSDSFSRADQAARIASGYQLIQTDHPWFQIDDRGASRPFRALYELMDDDALAEPGKRLFVQGPVDTATAGFASMMQTGDGCTAWETGVSNTRAPTDPAYPPGVRPHGVGCLRAASRPSDPSADAFEVCRATTDDEHAQARVTVWTGGAAQTTTMLASDHAAQGVGDLLRLEICTTAGVATVRAFSAGSIDATDTPEWVPVGGATFPEALPAQGLAAYGDVLFVGATHDGAAVSQFDLSPPAVPGAGMDAGSSSGTLYDLSYPPPRPDCHDPSYPIGCHTP